MARYRWNMCLHLVIYSLSISYALTCDDGFAGPACRKENIALHKPANQTDNFNPNFTPDKAVDGNTNTNVDRGSCAHTGKTSPSYWTVTLDSAIQYNITNITLYLRNTRGERYQNMTILVDNSFCRRIQINYTPNDGPPVPNPVYTTGCVQPMSGSHVTVWVDNAYLTLCEVQIWACQNGSFGLDCEYQCNCADNNETCDKKNGFCRSGCDKGYQGDGCQEECRPGTYDFNCNRFCGSCRNSTTCHHVTGVCPSGCEPGWMMTPKCDQKCMDMTYGDNCSYPCGQCRESLTCHHVTGSCENGCKVGWMTEKCNLECVNGTYGEDCLSNCGQCLNSDVCDTVTGTCPSGCVDGYMLPLCKERNLKPPVGAIVGGVLAAVIVGGIGIVILIFARRFIRKKAAKHDRETHTSNQRTAMDLRNIEEKGETETYQEAHSNDNPYEAIDPYYNNIPCNIPLEELSQYVRDKASSGGFKTEFQMIKYGLSAEHEVGKRPENKPRNRFVGLFPYDHSRVKLNPDGDLTWDYINASYVSGYSDKTIFIAAQGPKSSTVDDFWRMVWQQNVRKIVMLTQLMEVNKKKCEQYWPDDDEVKQCGNVTIKTSLSIVRADFTIRKFSIKHMNSKERTVTHFHFTTWPDHDVPAAPALVGFWKKVKLTATETDEETGPAVIHCSAGVGRTGTFIALDSLVTQAENENRVNVFMCVAKMREARMNMVQTVDQYQFVYEVLLEALKSHGTFYTLSEFEQRYGTHLSYTVQQEKELEKQFEGLQNLKAKVKDHHASDAFLPENINKNRSQEIMPTDSARPFLTTQVSGYNDYINAVMLPSAIRDNYFIVTQTPLPETVLDFWRLVYDHHCYTIVSLDNSKDAMALYPKEETTSAFGPFNVKNLSDDKSHDFFIHSRMKISHKDEPDLSRDLDVYHFATMETSGQHDTAAIIEIINVLDTHITDCDSRMLIHCFDGSRVSGVFCTLMNIVSRLRLDKEVDIFLTIRELQTIRPQFVSSFEQYKLCHDIVKEYNRSSNVYANL